MNEETIVPITEDTIKKISLEHLTEAEKALIISSAPGCESMINEVLGLSVQNVSIVRAWLICIEFITPSE